MASSVSPQYLFTSVLLHLISTQPPPTTLLSLRNNQTNPHTCTHNTSRRKKCRTNPASLLPQQHTAAMRIFNNQAFIYPIVWLVPWHQHRDGFYKRPPFSNPA